MREFPLGERYGDRPGSMKIIEIDRYPSLRELLSPRYLYLLSDGLSAKQARRRKLPFRIAAKVVVFVKSYF
jgi:hypothetical protein